MERITTFKKYIEIKNKYKKYDRNRNKYRSYENNSKILWR